jgi:hypothetical protein
MLALWMKSGLIETMILPENVREVPVKYCRDKSLLPSMVTTEGVVTWQEFYSTRNSILSAVRPFGTVGPMGEAPITADESGPPRSWAVETREPEYFVVDDQLNEISRYHYVEVSNSQSIVYEVIQALWEVIRTNPRWSIGVGIQGKAYILLNKEAVWISGACVEGCRSLDDIVKACQLQSHKHSPKRSRKRTSSPN